MDNSRRAHVEDVRQEEDTGGKHCPNIKTNRRRYSPNGIQSRAITRFAFLIPQAQATHANSSPATLRGFLLMLARFGRSYVNLLRMAGFAIEQLQHPERYLEVVIATVRADALFQLIHDLFGSICAIKVICRIDILPDDTRQALAGATNPPRPD
jgi:hypothetical protein